MSKMFHTCVDANGVAMSTNAHPESEYEGHRLKPSYYMEGKSMSQRVKDQVLMQSGARKGSMTFQSELSGEKR